MDASYNPFFEPRLVECPVCHAIIRGGPGNILHHVKDHGADLETLRDPGYE